MMAFCVNKFSPMTAAENRLTYQKRAKAYFPNTIESWTAASITKLILSGPAKINVTSTSLSVIISRLVLLLLFVQRYRKQKLIISAMFSDLIWMSLPFNHLTNFSLSNAMASISCDVGPGVDLLCRGSSVLLFYT